MKKLCITLVAFLVAVSLTGTAVAQSKPAKTTPPASSSASAEKPAKASAPAKRHQFTGEVTALDSAKSTLTVKGRGKEMSFSATGKAAKSLADIKTGDKVTVHYIEADGKFTATSIKKAVAATKTEKSPKKGKAPAKSTGS